MALEAFPTLAGMNRRTFVRRGGQGILAFGLPHPPIRRSPRPLRPGDRVGLVAPASRLRNSSLEDALTHLRLLGLEPVYDPVVERTWGEFAGTDRERADDLHRMYADESIRGIWAIRGGYGTNRLLDLLDFRLIRRNPKPLVGYSDITTLLNVIQQHTGSHCFHGPVAASTFSDYVRTSSAPLFSSEPFRIERAALEDDQVDDPLYRFRTIRPGVARGPLVGGNLTLLSSLAGTGYLPKSKGAVVFLEDIGEKPYRIDRMLTQLLDAGFFKNVAGVAVGILKGCGQTTPSLQADYSLAHVLEERLKPLPVPTAYGFSIGHITDQCFLPIGCEARVDMTEGTIDLLESPFR